MNTNTLTADDVRQIIRNMDAALKVLERMDKQPELRNLGAEYLNAARDRILLASLSDVAIEGETTA